MALAGLRSKQASAILTSSNPRTPQANQGNPIFYGRRERADCVASVPDSSVSMRREYPSSSAHRSVVSRRFGHRAMVAQKGWKARRIVSDPLGR
jgi:hypothetical protein